MKTICPPLVLCLTIALFMLGEMRAVGQTISEDTMCGTTPTASGGCSAAIGSGSTSSGSGAIAIGSSSSATYIGSMVIGHGSTSNGRNSLLIGNTLESQSASINSIVIGSGTVSTALSTSSSNILMMGMNSTIPSFFMTDAGGGSNLSKIGIGTTSPDGSLHLLNISTQNTDLIIEKSNTYAARLLFDDAGTIRGNLSLDANEDFELRNMTPSRHLMFNIHNGTAQEEVMRIIGSTTSVGIGRTTASAKLHVEQRVSGDNIGRFSVLNKDGSLTFSDPESTYYRPTISGISGDGGVSALHLTANVLAADDDVADTKPMMVFESKRYSSGANIVNRPLFEWRNNQTARMTMLADGNLGIGTTTPSGKLHVAGGNIRATGIPAGAGTEDVLGIEADGDFVNITQSSIHFKQNVQELSFDKEAFFSMDAVRFDWKEIYGGNPDVGFIAQQVEETFPEMGIYRHKRFYLDNGDFVRDSLGEPVVDTTQMEVRGVRYHKLPVYLYELAKQQEALNVELQQRLTELEERLNYCCAIQPSLRLGTEEEPMESDVKSYVLDQNDPNPFSDYTSIFVSVPQDVQSAQLMITGMNGRIIKVIDLEAGQSERLMVYSSEIGKGLFSYSLLLDGKVMETKKMASIR